MTVIKSVERYLFLSMIWLFVCTPMVEASNLQISNLNMVSVDAAANTMVFSCDVVEDNSWRSNLNYDAAWVFMKYSTDGFIFSGGNATLSGVEILNSNGIKASNSTLLSY